MKLYPVIVSIILAAGALGYATDASAQNPCSSSYPCQRICGNHVCAPGEVFAAGTGTAAANTTAMANATTMKATGTNATVANTTSSMAMGANDTATKTANATTGYLPPPVPQGNATLTPLMNKANATGFPMNSTTEQIPPTVITQPPAVPSPEKQVASGTSPADVKCQSGYQLALNKFDSRPACVTPDVMAKLVARGWAAAAQS